VDPEARPTSITWIGGLAIAPEAVLKLAQRLLPRAFHRVLPPAKWALDDIGSCDILVGYSFGAHLVWRAYDRFAPKTQLVLLAPFLDLRREAGSGGKVPLVVLTRMLRKFRLAPLEVIADFYAKLGLPDPPAALPYALDDLTWGLELMVSGGFGRPPSPASCHTVVGDEDPLVDCQTLATCLPKTSIISGSHALEPLARNWLASTNALAISRLD